jgi:asparagine N-glycosylation enzyme membrane subunit Stt3
MGVKALGSTLIAIIVGIFAIWLLIKLLGIALKLVGILVGVLIAVAVYFLAERLIRRSGHA